MNDEERFMSKVDRSGECWIWIGAKTSHGYGSFRDGAKNEQAHRWSYRHFKGPIPEKMYVCHNCPSGDNPACVNPDHLFLGTSKDNTNDAIAKGRRERVPEHMIPFLGSIRQFTDNVGERNSRAKLTEDIVRDIRQRAAMGESPRDIGAHYNTPVQTIRNILGRQTWRHI